MAVKLSHARLILVMFIAVSFVGLCALLISHCATHNYEIPKPDAYLYIEPYDSVYTTIDSVPMHIEINKSAKYSLLPSPPKDVIGIEGYWFNVYYPRYEATMHFTALKGGKTDILSHIKNFDKRVELNLLNIPSDNFVIQDTIHNFTTALYLAPEESVAPIQFIATDSVGFILSATLKFDKEITNNDSIRPVVDYITNDMFHLLETLKPYK